MDPFESTLSIMIKGHVVTNLGRLPNLKWPKYILKEHLLSLSQLKLLNKTILIVFFSGVRSFFIQMNAKSNKIMRDLLLSNNADYVALA